MVGHFVALQVFAVQHELRLQRQLVVLPVGVFVRVVAVVEAVVAASQLPDVPWLRPANGAPLLGPFE